MKYEGLKPDLFSRIASHLKENPQKVAMYHRLSYPDSTDMIVRLFAEMKMSTETECFEESLIGIAQHHAAYANCLLSLIGNTFPQDFIIPLIDTICGYLHPCMRALEQMLTEDPADLTFAPRRNRFQASKTHPQSLEILMLTESELPTKICSYFNRIIPDSAVLSDEPWHLPFFRKPFKKIIVENRTLHDPIVIEDLKKREYLNFFRKSYTSNLLLAVQKVQDYFPTIEKTLFTQAYAPMKAALSKEELDDQCKLDALYSSAKEKAAEAVSNYTIFIASIKKLISHIEQNGLYDLSKLDELCTHTKSFHAQYHKTVAEAKITSKRKRDTDEPQSQCKTAHLEEISGLIRADIGKIELHLFAALAEKEPEPTSNQVLTLKGR